jgi:hypothetical protein
VKENERKTALISFASTLEAALIKRAKIFVFSTGICQSPFEKECLPSQRKVLTTV